MFIPSFYRVPATALSGSLSLTRIRNNSYPWNDKDGSTRTAPKPPVGYFTGVRLHRPTKTDDLPANVLSHAKTRRLIGADGEDLELKTVDMFKQRDFQGTASASGFRNKKSLASSSRAPGDSSFFFDASRPALLAS